MEAVFNVVFDFVMWVVGLIPVTVIFGGIFPSPEPLINLLNKVSCIMPIGTVTAGLGAWLILANLDWLTSIVNWVIKKIPGVQ